MSGLRFSVTSQLRLTQSAEPRPAESRQVDKCQWGKFSGGFGTETKLCVVSRGMEAETIASDELKGSAETVKKGSKHRTLRASSEPLIVANCAQLESLDRNQESCQQQ